LRPKLSSFPGVRWFLVDNLPRVWNSLAFNPMSYFRIKGNEAANVPERVMVQVILRL
jgi:hypothetical protein